MNHLRPRSGLTRNPKKSTQGIADRQLGLVVQAERRPAASIHRIQILQLSAHLPKPEYGKNHPDHCDGDYLRGHALSSAEFTRELQQMLARVQLRIVGHAFEKLV